MITSTLNIAVDCGKHTTKAVAKINGGIQRVNFRTKVKEVTDFGIDLTPNSYILQQYGKSFVIGDMLGENTTDYNISKQSIEHKLCIYLAVSLFIKTIGLNNSGIINVNLAVNMPLSLYKNEVLKNKFKEYLLNNGEIIQLKVNSKLYSFRIKNLTICPEATASIYSRINDFRGKKATIIDIGSLNISYCSYNRLVPEIDTMTVTNNGVNILRGKIGEALTSKFNTLVSDEDVEQILRGDKFLYINGNQQVESKSIIETIMNEYVSQIFNYGKSRNLSFNNTDVIFCGGGAILLKDFIIKEFPSAKIESDSQFANVLSFYKILEVKYGQA